MPPGSASSTAGAVAVSIATAPPRLSRATTSAGPEEFFWTAAESRGNEGAARALIPRSAGNSSVIRPWQPAFPQAMQRHGGQTRPAGVPAAKAATPAREDADENNRGDAKIGTAQEKSNESKSSESKD
jgi:hypothetical protein